MEKFRLEMFSSFEFEAEENEDNSTTISSSLHFPAIDRVASAEA